MVVGKHPDGGPLVRLVNDGVGSVVQSKASGGDSLAFYYNAPEWTRGGFAGEAPTKKPKPGSNVQVRTAGGVFTNKVVPKPNLAAIGTKRNREAAKVAKNNAEKAKEHVRTASVRARFQLRNK
jgi:hypothetical protein